MPEDSPPDTAALFVRLPLDQAQRLDRAATALSAHKKDLVAGLVERYVRPDSPEGLEELREFASPTRDTRRVVIETQDQALTVGHHSFQPAPTPEVLDAAQAAELLEVEQQALLDLAEQGQLPGRKIGGQWRFVRRALLDWLSEMPETNQRDGAQ